MPKRPHDEPGGRVPVSLRVSARTKEALDRAANATGRSFSQEAEFRIERSFADDTDFPDATLKAWAVIIAARFHERGSFAAKMKGHPDWQTNEWIKDSDCYLPALIDVVEALFLGLPGANPEQVAIAFESTKGRLLTRFIIDDAEKRRTNKKGVEP